jgi:hypothetical protein
VTDIRELLRRLQLGEPDRRIARDLSLSRNTVAIPSTRASTSSSRVATGRGSDDSAGFSPDVVTVPFGRA